MTWSRGLKDAAGIDEVEDDEIVADDEDSSPEEDQRVLVIAKHDWRRIQDDADTLGRILELVEQDRVDEIAGLVPFEYPPPLRT